MTSKNNSLLFLSVSIAILVFAFFEVLAKIYDIAMNNDDYSHGLLLPFVAAYLVWIRKDEISESLSSLDPNKFKKKEFTKNLLSIGLATFGAVLFVAWRLSGLTFLGWVGFFSCFLAVICFSTRSPLLWTILGPISLMYMIHPLPASIVPRLFNPLQAMAAKASELALIVLGVPVFVQGNIIESPGMTLLVEEACSGLRSVFAMATVAMIVPMMYKISIFSRIVLLVLALALAVLLNTFRVVATGLMAHFYDPSAAEGFFHTFTGMIVFIVGLVFIQSFVNFVMKSEKVGAKK